MATTAFPASNPLAVSGYNAGNVATLVPDLPSLTFTRNGTDFTTASAAGTVLGSIGNVPTGVTPTVNLSQFAIGGSSGAWTLVVGVGTITATTYTPTISATGASSVTPSVVASASGSGFTAYTPANIVPAIPAEVTRAFL